MSARVENHSPFPIKVLRQLINRTLKEIEVNLPKINLRVRVFETSHWHHHGHFYAYRGQDTALIIARIPDPPGQLGHDRKLRGGPPPIDPRDWKEALVCIVAHEGTHLRQFMTEPKGKGYTRRQNGRVIEVGPRVFSEVEAEWAEYRALQHYRERRKS